MIQRFGPDRSSRGSTWNWVGGIVVVMLILGGIALMMGGSNTNVAAPERGASPATAESLAPATTGAASSSRPADTR